MIRKIIQISLLVIAVLYLTFSMTIMAKRPEGQICQQIDLNILGDTNVHYITPDDIRSLLKKNKLKPEGTPLNKLDINAIEQAVSKHPLIQKADCYKTQAGNIRIDIEQRIPILHILTDQGENFHVDQSGMLLKERIRSNRRIPIVTGKVEKSFATMELWQFGLFLQNNRFWAAQIEQIHVLPDQTVELVPRAGNHIIYLGPLEQFEKKLNRLKKFYEKGLNEIGWNKYTRINLEIPNQIICTKS